MTKVVFSRHHELVLVRIYYHTVHGSTSLLERQITQICKAKTGVRYMVNG